MHGAVAWSTLEIPAKVGHPSTVPTQRPCRTWPRTCLHGRQVWLQFVETMAGSAHGTDPDTLAERGCAAAEPRRRRAHRGRARRPLLSRRISTAMASPSSGRRPSTRSWSGGPRERPLDDARAPPRGGGRTGASPGRARAASRPARPRGGTRPQHPERRQLPFAGATAHRRSAPVAPRPCGDRLLAG